jgi:hypothetical protein
MRFLARFALGARCHRGADVGVVGAPGAVGARHPLGAGRRHGWRSGQAMGCGPAQRSRGNPSPLPAAFSGLATTCESRLLFCRRKHSQVARLTWPGHTPPLALRSSPDQGEHPGDVGCREVNSQRARRLATSRRRRAPRTWAACDVATSTEYRGVPRQSPSSGNRRACREMTPRSRRPSQTLTRGESHHDSRHRPRANAISAALPIAFPTSRVTRPHPRVPKSRFSIIAP